MSWWWLSLAWAMPLEDWVSQTQAAWEMTVTGAADAASWTDGVCVVTLEVRGGLQRVSDPTCEALRQRLAAGDESARGPLAMHLRTLATEGRALARQLETGAPATTPMPSVMGRSPLPGAPVQQAGQSIAQASAGLREAAAERWRQQRPPEKAPPRQGVVLAVAVASLVGFVFALLAQRRRSLAPLATPPPAASASFPETPEGRLRRRYVAWLARVSATVELDHTRHCDAELGHALSPDRAQLLRRASEAVAPVAYGGSAATGERRSALSWVEESL